MKRQRHKDNPFPMVFGLRKGWVVPLTPFGCGDKDCDAKTTFWNSEFCQHCYDYNGRCHEHRHQGRGPLGTLSSPPIISNSLTLQLDRAGSFRWNLPWAVSYLQCKQLFEFHCGLIHTILQLDYNVLRLQLNSVNRLDCFVTLTCRSRSLAHQ